MTAPTVTLCKRCGASATAHELATDQRTRTKRLGMVAGATSAVACPGFEAGEVVEVVDAGELRRRLDAVLALHVPFEMGGEAWCAACSMRNRMVRPHPCPTVRAARGES